ncbi:MAG: hypothetical protein K2L50_04110 [Bacteroidales bacterium]|nr:hypothetical protein [Bacteroidales bacterium]
MRIKKTGILWGLVCLLTASVYGQGIEVGKWRMHVAPTEILQMAQRGAEVFGVMEKELVYVDTRDNVLYEMNRTHGLSGVGISSVAYNETQDVLVVGYGDGLIDLVSGYNEVFSIADIRDKNLGVGKNIYRIVTEGRYAYLATQFGLVVVDVRKEEIKETYFIGENNTYVPVYTVALDKDYIYAATSEGLKYASRNAANLNDYAAWHRDSLFAGKQISYCVSAWGDIVLYDEGTLYRGGAGGWQVLKVLDSAQTLTALGGDEARLMMAVQNTATGLSTAEIWDAGQQPVFSIPETPYGITALLFESPGYLWLGLNIGRMQRFDMEGKWTSYMVRGPASNNCFSISSTGKGVTMAGGGYNAFFAPASFAFAVSLFENEYEGWRAYTSGNVEAAGLPSSVRSVTQVVEDPFQPGHLFAASSISGLVEIGVDGKWTLYDATNSALQNDYIYGSTCRVYDLAFDAEGNLWMLNAIASQSGLVCRKRNGEWLSYDFRVAGNAVDSRPKALMVDYWKQKWVIFDNQKLAVFKTDGTSIQGLQVNLNQGNTLNTNNVFCLVEDDLGHVWMGTDRGVKVIDQHARMFENPSGTTSSVNTKTIRVPTDGFLIELLNTDQVRAIAVDGANRKWLGTASGGVYLVSSDGMEEICHFTKENSPLPSDIITALAVDDRTGEVFIGTDGGLISYRGTATRTEGNPRKEARAFPNPVRPGYEGLINVKGLPQNAIVKITDTRGGLIYQGRATGGQLSWNGYGMNGKRPSSGVLFVFACQEDGSQTLACKIFYIR